MDPDVLLGKCHPVYLSATVGAILAETASGSEIVVLLLWDERSFSPGFL